MDADVSRSANLLNASALAFFFSVLYTISFSGLYWQADNVSTHLWILGDAMEGMLLCSLNRLINSLWSVKIVKGLS